MALTVKHKADIPDDVVLVTETEAMIYQWSLIHKWKPVTDVWPIRFGFHILGAAAGVSCLYINNHYRNKLRLLSYGRMSTYFPIVIIPVVANSFLQHQLVSSKILLQNECPVCLQVRSGSLQLALGFVYPMILAPMMNFNLADRYNTYNVPSIVHERREFFQFWRRMISKSSKVSTVIFMVNLFLAFGLTSYSTQCFYDFLEKLRKETETS